MAAIYEEIVLAWKGEEYTVQPNFRMVQQIESNGISILGVIKGIHEGQPLASQMGTIIAHMLHSGGAKGVTPDDVYAYIAQCSREEYLLITAAITAAFLPQETDSGNSGGPAEDGAETKAETSTKNPSTIQSGQSITRSP